MEDVLFVDEKYSSCWKWALILFLGLAIVLFLYSKSTAQVIVENYLQLGSFVSFIIAVFSMIKLWEGKKSIKIFFENNALAVQIFKRDALLQENSYKLSRVQSIHLISSEIAVPFLNIHIQRNDASTFQLLLKDEDRPFYLFHFGGHILSINNTAGKRLKEFLVKREVPVIH